MLFRAAGYDTPPDAVLEQMEKILRLDGDDVLRYADRKKGQRRTARLQRMDDHEALTGFVLSGDTSAQAWTRTLQQDELPAQAYGWLLLPGARPPVAVQSRGKLVCTCFNITDTDIKGQLDRATAGNAGENCLATADDKLASLKETLKCGTNCGSCIPELKKVIRFFKPADAAASA